MGQDGPVVLRGCLLVVFFVVRLRVLAYIYVDV